MNLRLFFFVFTLNIILSPLGLTAIVNLHSFQGAYNKAIQYKHDILGRVFFWNETGDTITSSSFNEKTGLFEIEKKVTNQINGVVTTETTIEKMSPDIFYATYSIPEGIKIRLNKKITKKSAPETSSVHKSEVILPKVQIDPLNSCAQSLVDSGWIVIPPTNQLDLSRTTDTPLGQQAGPRSPHDMQPAESGITQNPNSRGAAGQ